MQAEETIVGRVRVAASSEVLLVVTGDDLVKKYEGRTYRICQVGGYLKFPQTDCDVIGVVVEATQRDTTPTPAGEIVLTTARRELRVQLVGSLRGGAFARGVTSAPTIDDPGHIAVQADVEAIFGSASPAAVQVGRLSSAPDVTAFIDANLFYAHHNAVVGGTGSGKSSAVAALLEKASRLKSSHVILLDLHNEYTSLFGDAALTVPARDLRLPYWLLNFEEMQDLFVEVAEETAHNQVMQLKELVSAAKREANVGLERISVDSPVYFDLKSIREGFERLDVEMVPGSTGRERQGPFYGQFTRLIARLDSRIADVRYDFMYSTGMESSESLADYLTAQLGYGHHAPRITILDLSGIPSDVLGVVVAVICRVIFDYQFWLEDPTSRPVVIALEEAHNYVPRHATGTASAAARSVERIAKEGRKYGLGLMLISQRPSELSETVLAQAGTFVAMRLTNPSDQAYTKAIVPDVLADIMAALPALERGEAIVCGEGVMLPCRVLLDPPSEFPRSRDALVWEEWSAVKDPLPPIGAVHRWQRQGRVAMGTDAATSEPDMSGPS